jgi:hypothetical protein
MADSLQSDARNGTEESDSKQEKEQGDIQDVYLFGGKEAPLCSKKTPPQAPHQPHSRESRR